MILRVICEKPSCGYDIIREIETISNGKQQVKTGTMYTTLRRMEQEKLLASKWEKNKEGPDKRIYRITGKGKMFLKKWLEMVMERRKMMDKLAKFYKGQFGGEDNES